MYSYIFYSFVGVKIYSSIVYPSCGVKFTPIQEYILSFYWIELNSLNGVQFTLDRVKLTPKLGWDKKVQNHSFSRVKFTLLNFTPLVRVIFTLSTEHIHPH